ncbi:MAG TPA: c(7)-type cytochrome triheme domain-containing protein [Xanthomonadales bacterium]|jgi:c(7)-type cytochrome triheme protein
MKQSRLVLFVLLMFCVSSVFAQAVGTKKRAPKPDEYGNVVINNYSEEAGISPVVFSHWLHRSMYTCRLCHVDLGFAMEAGETLIREEDNRNGLYCGACHNGKKSFTTKVLDGKEPDNSNCDRCHSQGKDIVPQKEFYEFVKDFPRSRFGNRVDWLKAEELGLIKLNDYLKGVSIKRGELKYPSDFEIDAKFNEMPDIIFSHEKHAVWNGCELCHPQIFSIKKASTVFDMQAIFDGKYCGACHGSVAFTPMDCQLCHSTEIK